MKTQHTLRQSVLITLTAVFLMSLTASASQFYSQLIMPAPTDNSTWLMPNTNTFETQLVITPDMIVECFTIETEANLEMEEWMVNDELFAAPAYFFEIETEEELELENWMIEDQHFGTFIEIEEEVEEQLKIENWMTNASIWK